MHGGGENLQQLAEKVANISIESLGGVLFASGVGDADFKGPATYGSKYRYLLDISNECKFKPKILIINGVGTDRFLSEIVGATKCYNTITGIKTVTYTYGTYTGTGSSGGSITRSTSQYIQNDPFTDLSKICVEDYDSDEIRLSEKRSFGFEVSKDTTFLHPTEKHIVEVPVKLINLHWFAIGGNM